MIPSNSRYSNGYKGKVTTPRLNESSPYVYRKFDVQSDVEYKYYQWTEGDRLDVVAHRLYGDSSYWYKILDLNPSVPDAWSIPAGQILRIPERV